MIGTWALEQAKAFHRASEEVQLRVTGNESRVESDSHALDAGHSPLDSSPPATGYPPPVTGFRVVSGNPWFPKIAGKLKAGIRVYSDCPKTYSWEGLQVDYLPMLFYPFGKLDTLFNRLGEPLLQVGWWSIKSRMMRIVREFQPDVVYAHHTVPNGYFAMRIQKEAGIPFVVTDHEMGEITDCEIFPARRAVYEKVIASAHRMVSVAGVMRRDMERVFPQARCEVIHNGINLSGKSKKLKENLTIEDTIERWGRSENRKLGKAEGGATESWPQMGAASGTMQVKDQPEVGPKGTQAVRVAARETDKGSPSGARRAGASESTLGVGTSELKSTEEEDGAHLASQAGALEPDSLTSKLASPVSESRTRFASGPAFSPATRNSLTATAPEEPPLVILSCGMFYERKNFPGLIHAFNLIAEKYPNVILKIFGDGPDRPKIEKARSASPFKDRIEMPGKISHQDVLEEMHRADIFALIGWSEPFGVVFLEAMAAGLPIVACADAGVAEVIRSVDFSRASSVEYRVHTEESQMSHGAEGANALDSGAPATSHSLPVTAPEAPGLDSRPSTLDLSDANGILVPPRDINAAARALEFLILNPNVRNQLADAAKKKIEAELTWSAANSKYLKLFNMSYNK